MILRPQAGPQEMFLSSEADIVIYGGAAGGGKSYGLLLEPLRHVINNPKFNAVFFRRTTTQVRNPGGLWDESKLLYSGIAGAEPVEQPLEWRFNEGGKVKFAHLEHDSSIYDWQGAQIPLICFDELTHFSAVQFWYMLSRNRSMSGVRPYVRATCNPDADSWVAEFIGWWIDQDTGLSIPDRAGVLRYFVRVGETLHWADDPAELAQFTMTDDETGLEVPIPAKSVTFIPAKLSDNKALVRTDPAYRANLMALTFVERERLIGGNWKVRPAAGLYFQRFWCGELVTAAPAKLTLCRGWDLAATPDTGSNDPDWTSGVLLGRSEDKTYYVLDCRWLRGTPSKVQDLILHSASTDKTAYGPGVTISIPQDPAQAGKSQAADFVKRLAGYVVKATPEARNPGGNTTPSKQSAKITRFSPFSAQAEAGNVRVLAGAWNARWFDEMEAFPEARHDDSADATSRSFNQITIAPAPAQVGSLRL